MEVHDTQSPMGNPWEQVCFRIQALEFRFLRNIIHFSTLFNTTLMTPDKINSYFYSKTIFIHIKRDEPRLQTVFCQFRSGFVTPKCFQSILDLGVEKQAVVGLS